MRAVSQKKNPPPHPLPLERREKICYTRGEEEGKSLIFAFIKRFAEDLRVRARNVRTYHPARARARAPEAF